VWVVTQALLLAVVQYFIMASPQVRKQGIRHRWFLIGFIILGHISSIFGTESLYQYNATHHLYFSATVIILLYSHTHREFHILAVLTKFTLITFFLTGTYHSLASPYRLDVARWEMTYQVPIRSDAETITVSEEFGKSIEEINALREQMGFEAGTPIIDMTGQRPGLVYILDGRAPGIAWVGGGYPSSESLQTINLSKWKPQQLNQAWIMTMTDKDSKTSRNIDTAILNKPPLSLDYPSSYRMVGSVTDPLFDEEIMFWQPIR
jgi:hypothetical protein